MVEESQPDQPQYAPSGYNSINQFSQKIELYSGRYDLGHLLSLAAHPPAGLAFLTTGSGAVAMQLTLKSCIAWT